MPREAVRPTHSVSVAHMAVSCFRPMAVLFPEPWCGGLAAWAGRVCEVTVLLWVLPQVGQRPENRDIGSLSLEKGMHAA